MKKLITLLAVFGFATTAMADDHMKQNGSFRTIYNNSNDSDFNSDAGDRSQTIMQRLIWSPSFKVSDALSVHTTLVHASVWGNNPTDQTPGPGSTGNVTEDNALVVNEAYANWMINDESMLRFGRGSFTMGDGRVVSSNDWEQVRKGFDGLMYSHDHEAARASLFAVRGANGNGSNNYGNFFGLNVDFKSLPEFLKTANLHYIIVKRDDATYPGLGPLDDEDTTRLGLTVGGDTAGVDYSLTYAMYNGETTTAAGVSTDVKTSMYDATVGYSMPDMMNFRISAQMHSDTGSDGVSADNETYGGFHYDTHNNAGLMDIVGYGNLTFTRVGFTMDPKDDLTVGVDYYMFSATEDGAGTTTFNTGGVANGDISADDTKDDIGTEIDVWVAKQYSSNFSTKFRYGTFDPGDRMAASGDAESQFYLEGMMTF